MKKTTTTFNVNNTIYEVDTFPCSLTSAIAEVYIYEVVRPNWKIFRRSYCNSFNFFVEEFNSIEEGTKYTFKKFLQRLEEREKIQQKWENLTK